MGKGDGWIEPGGEALLHSRESWQDRRLLVVFNLQGSEIVFILLIALVVLGPEKLPDAARRFTKTYAELKKMGSGFQSELKSAFDEPVKQMQQTASMMQNAVDPRSFDASKDTRDADVETAQPESVSEDADVETTPPEPVSEDADVETAPPEPVSEDTDVETAQPDPAEPTPVAQPFNNIAAANSSASIASRDAAKALEAQELGDGAART